ncbi:MAG: hypothetical protein KGZ79_02695 [Dethiobacter sp.]|nr:hypothetical protein [Dethiobacter sp.]
MILKIGVTNVDPFVAAAIRIPVAALVLTCFVLSRKKGEVLQFKKYGLRNMAMAACAGILAYGIAAVAM